jgi:hypothetical protein
MANSETDRQIEKLSSGDGDDVRIDARNWAQVARWARELGVPEDQFRTAAEQAGPRLGDIKQHLIGGFTGAGPTS